MISTKLYNDQSIERFKLLTGQIQQTQAKIATGKNVMKASDDPVAAANISFVKGQKVVLERYATNIQRADKRLTLVENLLGEAANPECTVLFIQKGNYIEMCGQRFGEIFW